MSRNDIIKHFKKLAEHSTFLQYAAESAERIGWALEVNLRDNRGRVILQLGSEPGVHWVSNLPGECVTGVAGQAPSVEIPAAKDIAPKCVVVSLAYDDCIEVVGGTISMTAETIRDAVYDRLRQLDGRPRKLGPFTALGDIGGRSLQGRPLSEDLIHRNGASDGTGPARAARRERMAEAINRSMAGNKSYAVAAAAKAMAAGSGGDDFEVIAVDEITGELPPAFFGIDLGSKDGDVATYAAPSTDPVATASLSVEAMEPVRPDTSRQRVQPWAVRYIGLYCDTEDASCLVWAWECNEGKYVLGVWTESKNTFDFVRDPRTCPSWTLVKSP